MISCESQSQIHTEKDCYSSTEIEQEIPSPPTLTLEQLEQVIGTGSDEEFQAIIMPLSSIISLHVDHKLFANKMLHYRLMKYFYRTFKAMDDSSDNAQYHLVFIMSLLAQISRKNSKVRLPFTRNIVLALLSFDATTIKTSNYGNQILKILSVLFQNLSRQGKAVMKLGVSSELKQGLLLLTSRVDELFTLRILLKAIRQLTIANHIIISKQEIDRSNIVTNLHDHFGKQIANKVKVMLCHMKCTQKKEGSTIMDLICGG